MNIVWWGTTDGEGFLTHGKDFTVFVAYESFVILALSRNLLLSLGSVQVPSHILV